MNPSEGREDYGTEDDVEQAPPQASRRTEDDFVENVRLENEMLHTIIEKMACLLRSCFEFEHSLINKTPPHFEQFKRRNTRPPTVTFSFVPNTVGEEGDDEAGGATARESNHHFFMPYSLIFPSREELMVRERERDSTISMCRQERDQHLRHMNEFQQAQEIELLSQYYRTLCKTEVSSAQPSEEHDEEEGASVVAIHGDSIAPEEDSIAPEDGESVATPMEESSLVTQEEVGSLLTQEEVYSIPSQEEVDSIPSQEEVDMDSVPSQEKVDSIASQEVDSISSQGEGSSVGSNEGDSFSSEQGSPARIR